MRAAVPAASAPRQAASRASSPSAAVSPPTRGWGHQRRSAGRPVGALTRHVPVRGCGAAAHPPYGAREMRRFSLVVPVADPVAGTPTTGTAVVVVVTAAPAVVASTRVTVS